MKLPSTLLDRVKSRGGGERLCRGEDYVNKKERPVLIQDVDKCEGGGQFSWKRG